VCSAPFRMASTSRRAPAAWCSGTCSRCLPEPEFNAAGLHGLCQPPQPHARRRHPRPERHGLSHAWVARPVGSASGVKRQAVLPAPIRGPPDPPA
jgi:hypothetical protein